MHGMFRVTKQKQTIDFYVLHINNGSARHKTIKSVIKIYSSNDDDDDGNDAATDA